MATRSGMTAALRSRTGERPPTPRQWLVVLATLVCGAAVLGWALSLVPGDPLFQLATPAVALIWIGGAVASGQLRGLSARFELADHGRDVLLGLVWGGALLVIFLVGALVVARVPVLAGPVEGLLDHARTGPLWQIAAITALNGIAEELFFRGAVYEVLPRGWSIPLSTLLYASFTLTSGVALLTFAAICLGVLAALLRRRTGRLIASVTAHLAWSLGMLFLLPQTLELGA